MPNAPRFVTCHCQHCNGGIEFDGAGFAHGETRAIECPHCGIETNLFVPYRPPPIPQTPPRPQQPSRKAQVLRFKNPANGYTESVDENVWLLVLLFGCFYFAAKGVWTHAVAGFIAAVTTCGISWLVYPLVAKDIMVKNYLRRGWIQVE
jgi:hypothetical protein